MSLKYPDELFCDFVQYYHVFDISALPYDRAGILISGLPDDSRVKKKIAGFRVPMETLLQARMVDYLALLLWSKTEDCRHKRNRPASVFDMLTSEEKKKKIKKFRSAAAFDAAYKTAVGGG